MFFSSNSWESIRDTKLGERSDRLALVKTLEDISVADDLQYLSAFAAEIVANIAARKQGWSALRVMEAYVRSSARSQELTNCLVSRHTL
jgi:hypothetical protein